MSSDCVIRLVMTGEQGLPWGKELSVHAICAIVVETSGVSLKFLFLRK